ncbi:MAG TPA: aminoglycoside adenylyltransferase domain-containing protein [Acidimicrobiia bacterium]|nr:aminoglycoside adenylyltransferase domain-containing protein [Acidimicrobiia bacterium]
MIELITEFLTVGDPGAPPPPRPDPDVAVLVTSVLQDAAVQLGPPPAQILEPVPEPYLGRTFVDSLPTLMADPGGDERNVLLTLARMLVTLELAAAGYRGETRNDWTSDGGGRGRRPSTWPPPCAPPPATHGHPPPPYPIRFE